MKEIDEMKKETTNDNPVLMQIVSKLNSIETAWTKQFDIAPHTQICFSVSSLGILCLNDIPLNISALDVDTDSIFVGVEHFGFRTRNSDTYVIRVQWPYDGTPRLDTMQRITTLQAAN